MGGEPGERYYAKNCITKVCRELNNLYAEAGRLNEGIENMELIEYKGKNNIKTRQIMQIM